VLPLKTSIPTRRLPIVNILLILANCFIFAYQLQLGPQLGLRFIYQFGAVPFRFTHTETAAVTGLAAPPPPITLITSMFLHGSLFHIGGNMLYLWIFGNNIEDYLGHIRYLLFYLTCGVLAAIVHILNHPYSTIPMVGASGAVSGVLGAYFLLYPQARILTAVFFGFFVRLVLLPAKLFLGLWILVQLLNSTQTLGVARGVSGVAWLAHVGGFLAGILLVRSFRGKRRRRYVY